jgi:NTE family protein
MFQSFAFLFNGAAPPVQAAEPERAAVRPSIGVALGGGAARGWAHIGVLKRLAAHGIEPDVIAGTSIGALVGGCHAAGKLADVEELARSLNKRKVLSLLDVTLGAGGLIGGRKLEELLVRGLAERSIESLPRTFVAVATEIGTGHEIWLTRGPLVEAMRASYALPGVFGPVRIDGRWLFDGALTNPIPVSVCRAFGARLVIAVNLSNPAHPRAANGESAKAVAASAPAPGLTTVVVEAFNITQDRIARSRLAGDPPDVMLSPRLAGIGLFDFHRADEAIAAGEEAAERALADIAAAGAALER